MVVMGMYVHFWWVQACGAAGCRASGSPGLRGCSFIRFCQQFSRVVLPIRQWGWVLCGPHSIDTGYFLFITTTLKDMSGMT